MEIDIITGMKIIEKNRKKHDKEDERLLNYWKKLIEFLEKYCTKTGIAYQKTAEVLSNKFNPRSSEAWINMYFSDGKNLHILDTNQPIYYFKIITVKELFQRYQIPYIKSEEADKIYLYICHVIKKTKDLHIDNAKIFLHAGNREPLTFLYYHALYKYYLSCHKDGNFVLPFLLSHPKQYFYVEHGNLLYHDSYYQQYICFTQETLYDFFEQYKIPLPYSKKTLQNVFKYLKQLVKYKPIPLLPEQACVMVLKNLNSQHYKYVYNPENRKMQLYYLTNAIRSNNYVSINTKHNAELTPTIIEYFSRLVCNDRTSLITLAKLAATQYSTNQPNKKIIFVEASMHEKENLQLFLSAFCHTIIHSHSLSELCNISCLFNIPVHSNFLDYIDHKQPIYFSTDLQSSKLTKRNLSTIKTLVSGKTLCYEDSIMGILHYHNYIPIIYFSNNLDDYVYLKKHFDCSILKINPTKMEIPRFSNSEREWFYRIFLPYGREILSNGHNNILRYQPKQKSIPISSIECFMNNFTMYSNNNHIYPEELYASFKQFSEHGNPNGQICKKAVFIKLVRSLKAYNYTRIHIRQTKEHDASNRYGFKNLTINTERLNQYLSNTGDASIGLKDLKNELESITEHYKDLFDTAIPEPPAEPVTVNLS